MTSTLSSQAPAAVGRALAIGMPASSLPSDSISFVTVGDGSVNNAHFLSATNMSEYSEFRRVRCPVLFGISDNRLCISLRGYGWLNRFLEKLRMRVFQCNGNNVFDVYRSTAEAAAYCRDNGKPATVVYQDIQRRFGHAATDRQHAYMSDKEIDRLVHHNPVEGICAQVQFLCQHNAHSFMFCKSCSTSLLSDHQAIAEGLLTADEVVDTLEATWEATKDAFDIAAAEAKHSSRDELVGRLAPPLSSEPPPEAKIEDLVGSKLLSRPAVMRVQMNRAYREALLAYPNAVYLGEDVRHGGYYNVTEHMTKE